MTEDIKKSLKKWIKTCVSRIEWLNSKADKKKMENVQACLKVFPDLLIKVANSNHGMLDDEQKNKIRDNVYDHLVSM